MWTLKGLQLAAMRRKTLVTLRHCYAKRPAMDPLVELPVQLWPIMRDKAKSLWPLNVSGYYLLDSCIKNPQMRELFELKVYCPYGETDNGFVATNVMSRSASGFFIFPGREDTSKLEEAVVKTKNINWGRGLIHWNMLSSPALKCLYRIQYIKRFETFNIIPMKILLMQKDSKKFDVSCPPYTDIAPVREEHVEHINKAWSVKNESSHEYFSKLLSCGRSYGLYHKDKLAAWVFISEYNRLTHIYCESEFRREGYAYILMKHVLNNQLDEGNDVTACVLHGNTKSLQLALKTGMQLIEQSAMVFSK